MGKWEMFHGKLPCLTTGGKSTKNGEDILKYQVYRDGYWNVIGLVAPSTGRFT
jgi:hypothetical protein